MVKSPSQSIAPEGAPKAGATRPMRLLVAEDNPANRMILQAYLGMLRLDLVFAENGREALHYWRIFAPDLILMDISMPEMSGDEAARLIRKAEVGQRRCGGGTSFTPIIALSAHDVDHPALGPAFSGHLAKPFEKPHLMALLARHCPPDAAFHE